NAGHDCRLGRQTRDAEEAQPTSGERTRGSYMSVRSFIVATVIIAPLGCGGASDGRHTAEGIKRMNEGPWKYTIEFDRLPERLGTSLRHTDIQAAGLTIRVDAGHEPCRSVAITAEGNQQSLSCCEFHLFNGEEQLNSYSFGVMYLKGSKSL